ncbi:MAG: helix-hairpin-helix domain-containing protein [Patescibacteria group bacterium]
MAIKFGVQKIRKYWLEVILISLSVLITVSSLLLYTNDRGAISAVEEEPLPGKTPKKVDKKYVDLSGSVKNPGLYEASDNERLDSVIKRAGGLTEDADKDFFSRNYNLSDILVDRQKIYIPSIWDVRNGYFIEEQHKISADQTTEKSRITEAKIDVNEATREELETLPGIGQVTSQRIIDNRPYGALQELVDKKSISQKMLENINDLITF